MRNYSYLSILSFYVSQQKINLMPKRGNIMENQIEHQSFEFAVRTVNLYKYLVSSHQEFDLFRQFLRSGTSIGANVAEAQKAQSYADFSSKMYIALKEANETQYWLRLFHRIGYLNDTEYSSIKSDIDSIISLLMAITKSTKDDR